MNTFVRRLVGAGVVALLAVTAGACGAPTDSPPPTTSSSASSSASTPDAEATATPGPVTIYLTRHGQTMLNALGRAQGWADSPLTAEGRDQAESLGRGLADAGIEFESAYSADMVRHFETASLALSAMGSPLVPERDAGLREISFGAYEGAEDPEMWGAIMQASGYDDMTAMLSELSVTEVFDRAQAVTSADGLESEGGTAVGQRAIAVLERVAADQAAAGGGDVFVVSSGLTIVFALTQLGVDPAAVAGGIHNGAVSELRYQDGALTIVGVNDESYIERGGAG